LVSDENKVLFLLFSVILCSKFYFLMYDGVSYMEGVNGSNVRTTKNKNNADIFRIEYRNDSLTHQIIRVVTKQNIMWDIAANKTNLHYWRNDSYSGQQYFQIINLPLNQVGVITGNGYCLEYKSQQNIFQREPCNLSNNKFQRFMMLFIEDELMLKFGSNYIEKLKLENKKLKLENDNLLHDLSSMEEHLGYDFDNNSDCSTTCNEHKIINDFDNNSDCSTTCNENKNINSFKGGNNMYGSLFTPNTISPGYFQAFNYRR
ncbi:hypothetical protein SLOPH_766, partial [Spraguea lophii 42_110]